MYRILLSTTAALSLAACNVSVTPTSPTPTATPTPAAAAPATPAPAPAAPAAPASTTGDASAPTSSTQAMDATNQNFTIHNRTGQAIMRLFVSAVSTNSWEEDILGRDILPNGESATIRFPRAETACAWDIKVELQDGTSSELRGVNLCQTTDVNVG